MKRPAARKNLRKRTPKAVPSVQLQKSGRNANGKFAKGNTAQLVHGERSEAVKRADLPEMADLKVLRAQQADGIVADLGGADRISVLRRDLIQRYLETANIADYLAGHVLRDGVLTTKGKTRAAVTTYLSVVDRLSRLATAIGLERQAKPVPSIHEFLAQRQSAAQETPHAD